MSLTNMKTPNDVAAYQAEREEEYRDSLVKDCPFCNGTGIRHTPNGEDDYNLEICLHE